MTQLAERAFYRLCRGVGGLIRSSGYSKVWIVSRDGQPEVRKKRRFYAPLLIWLGGPVLRLLNTGVRVLPQRDWIERERAIYELVHGATIQLDATGSLVLPLLPGHSLATLLEDPQLEEPSRLRAIRLAITALCDMHRAGSTHGDAMAENVLVDLEHGSAHWIDFETRHDPRRPIPWRRADDVRALLATCLLRTSPEKLGSTIDLVLGAYPDHAVTRLLTGSFTSVLRRSLTFHLGQAGMPFERFRQIGRLLTERSGVSGAPIVSMNPE